MLEAELEVAVTKASSGILTTIAHGFQYFQQGVMHYLDFLETGE